MKKAPRLTVGIAAAIAIVGAAFSAIEAQSKPLERRTGAAEQSELQQTSAEEQAPADSAETEEDPATEIAAPELLRAARRKLLGYRSVKAGLIETVVVRDRKLRASGTYLQGDGLKLKMHLHLNLGEGGRYKATMLQVCDGQVLWTAHRFGRQRSGKEEQTGVEQRVTRRDVKQILREAARHNQVPAAVLFAELGLGGITELLGSLEQTMAFGTVRSRTIDNKPFLVVQGRWNFDVLKNLLDESELEELRSSGETRRLPRLPEHVPDIVRLYFERDSLFPRRVLYLKRPEFSESLRPMLSLNFVDVVLNAAVKESEFVFAPPDKVYPLDVTPKYIRRIRQAAKAANRRE